MWHRQNTVFDVDAWVTTTDTQRSEAADLRTARSLVAELQHALTELSRELGTDDAHDRADAEDPSGDNPL